MPKLIKIGFEDSEHEYELSLNWDDEAYVERQIKFDVEVKRRHLKEDAWQQPQKVSASLENDEELGPVIRVSSQDFDEVFPLGSLLDESQIIDKIPAYVFGGDLIIGCLVRSGLSATVGQLILCKNETAGIGWFKDRAKVIMLCVRENIPAMGGRLTIRALKCMARFGV